MSIINQALQKAQREQLVHSRQETPYLVPVSLARVSRRRWWWLLPLGLIAALSGWVTAPVWLRSPAPPLPVVTGALVQQHAPDAFLPRQSLLAPPTGGERDAGAQAIDKTPYAHPLPEGERQVSPPEPIAPAATPVMAVVPLPRVTVAPPSGMAAAAGPARDALASVAPTGTTPTSIETMRLQTLMQRALAAQEAGELPRAISLLEQAVKLDPVAKAAYNSLGNVYYQQGRYQQAITMYHKALAIDPEYAKARNNLGSTYMQLAMDERAIEELQKALQVDSAYGLAYYNLACVYARGGDSATAAQYLQQAIVLEPQARAWAQTDADFARVRTAPDVQQLLGP